MKMALAVLTGVALITATACSGKKKQEVKVEKEEAPIVETQLASEETVQLTSEYTATVEAFKTNSISATGMNRIKRIMVDVGSHVHAGQALVALDDVVSLVAYSIAISIALAGSGSRGSGFETIGKPILVNLFVLALGGFFGFLLKLLFRKRSTDNRLIVSLATLFAFCGVCALLDVSPLLGCMSMGMVYINLTNDSNLFQQLAYFSPPVLLL